MNKKRAKVCVGMYIYAPGWTFFYHVYKPQFSRVWPDRVRHHMEKERANLRSRKNHWLVQVRLMCIVVHKRVVVGWGSVQTVRVYTVLYG